ncbi:hypothetical protein JCM19233_5698 [Vibrio astriarenae]|nr:hypothetical protein JCM19233_5698 [Vibrio sp. C7]
MVITPTVTVTLNYHFNVGRHLNLFQGLLPARNNFNDSIS